MHELDVIIFDQLLTPNRQTRFDKYQYEFQNRLEDFYIIESSYFQSMSMVENIDIRVFETEDRMACAMEKKHLE